MIPVDFSSIKFKDGSSIKLSCTSVCIPLSSYPCVCVCGQCV